MVFLLKEDFIIVLIFGKFFGVLDNEKFIKWWGRFKKVCDVELFFEVE